MIVQFLAAIGIPDIAPAVVANAEMLAVEGADDGPPGRQVWVSQQRHERLAIQACRRRRHVRDLEHRGVKVNQAHRFAGQPSAGIPAAVAGRGHNQQRHAGGALPARPLAPMLLFSQVPAVVAPDDDRRVAALPGGFQRVEQPADLRIHEINTSQVRRHRRRPLIVLDHRRMRSRGRRTDRDLPSDRPQVIEIVFQTRRQLNGRVRERLEVFRRRPQRDVRSVKPHGQEERLR